jgi:hypothetical protein
MTVKLIRIFLLLLMIDVFQISCMRCDEWCNASIVNSNTWLMNGHNILLSDKTIVSIIPFDSLLFQHSISHSNISCTQLNYQGFLLQPATAFKCAPPRIKIADAINTIKIFTINDYNNSFLAGAEITSICVAKFNNSLENNVPLNSVVDSIQVRLNQNFEYSIPLFYTKLLQQPSNLLDTMQLKYMYILASGKVIVDSSAKFIIQ